MELVFKRYLVDVSLEVFGINVGDLVGELQFVYDKFFDWSFFSDQWFVFWYYFFVDYVVIMDSFVIG